MKKLSYIMILGLMAAAFSITSCSDSDFESKYADPSKTNTVSCDKLLTGVLFEATTSNVRYGMAAYWRLFTFDTQFLGRLCDVYGYTGSKSAYEGLAASYNNNRWNTFYRMLAQYKLMQEQFNSEDEASQAKNKVFLNCATIWVYDQLQQMVDLWGNIPYSEACTVQLTGDVATGYPAYDKAETLYEMMMDDLLKISAELNSMTLDADVAANFARQDFVCKGQKDLWAKYASGLCARIALRCSTQGSLSSKGQSVLKQVFGGSLPLVTSNADEILVNIGTVTGDFNLVTGGAFGLQEGWESWEHACNTASQAMLDAMNANTGNADPRLQVIYARNNKYDDQYHGKSPFEKTVDQSAWSDSLQYYACLDSTTFSRNDYYLDPKMSAAEVHLTQAEAVARGYIGGDAKSLFVKGVVESINYYYALNAASKFGNPKTKPSDADIQAYAESQWDAANPVKCIATQYWLHMGIGNTIQALMNVRRTGYPELTFVDWTSSKVDCPLPIDRLKYPESEVQNNKINLANELQASFGGIDTNYSPIFWAKASKTWFRSINEPK